MACQAKGNGAERLRRSFDSEDDLDTSMAAELAVAADPAKLRKMAQHFELAWKIRKVR